MKNKRIVLLIIAVLLLSIFGCFKMPLIGKAKPEIILAINPKVGVYYTSPVMSREDAENLARFHLVIADMENLVNNPENLKFLKKLNPLTLARELNKNIIPTGKIMKNNNSSATGAAKVIIKYPQKPPKTSLACAKNPWLTSKIAKLKMEK